MNITICGGGNLGHVVAGVLASQEDVSVRLLTQHPSEWSNELLISDQEGKIYRGKLETISDDPEEVIPDADYAILCLPGFAIRDELASIKPCLTANTVMGSIVSSTGFFFTALDVLSEQTPLFGFQRVPYISRINEYGRSANLLGYKKSLSIAVERSNDKEQIRKDVERLFNTPTTLLKSHFEVSLTNSNPLLHTARLYTMWKDWNGEPLERNPLFYAEWTDEASELLISMDGEFQRMLTKLPVADVSITPILEYYESHDTQSLTEKIRGIKAFRGILSPMRPANGGYTPDFASRYFTEDFPYGMRFIVECADKYGAEIPIIKKIYNWGCLRLK